MSKINYRWIMYLHHPQGGFDLQRVASHAEARSALVTFCAENNVYHDELSPGQYGASATLYPYSEEAWEEAEEYRTVGNPFDYPSYIVTRGPRGGTRVESA